MSKAPKAADAGAPPKSKKMLIIIIALVVILAGGGAAAFFLMKPHHPPKGAEGEAEAQVEEPTKDEHAAAPKYMELGTFTANLVHEEGDRYLQITISLKLSSPEMEEKVKASNPEILHRVNMLLQSKRPSELSTVAGKELLAKDLKTHINYVLGFVKKAPKIVTAPEPDSTAETPAPQSNHAADEEDDGESHKSSKGVVEVLFTSFIIQ